MNNPWKFQKDWLGQTAAKNRQSYPVENDRKDVNGLDWQKNTQKQLRTWLESVVGVPEEVLHLCIKKTNKNYFYSSFYIWTYVWSFSRKIFRLSSNPLHHALFA